MARRRQFPRDFTCAQFCGEETMLRSRPPPDNNIWDGHLTPGGIIYSARALPHLFVEESTNILAERRIRFPPFRFR